MSTSGRREAATGCHIPSARLKHRQDTGPPFLLRSSNIHSYQHRAPSGTIAAVCAALRRLAAHAAGQERMPWRSSIVFDGRLTTATALHVRVVLTCVGVVLRSGSVNFRCPAVANVDRRLAVLPLQGQVRDAVLAASLRQLTRRNSRETRTAFVVDGAEAPGTASASACRTAQRGRACMARAQESTAGLSHRLIAKRDPRAGSS